MLKHFYISILWLLFFTGFAISVQGQRGGIDRLRGAAGRLGGSGGSSGKADSLQHRTGLEDSITINFRFPDSSRLRTFDSSITDFTLRYPLPWHHIHLGNFGTATRSLIFSPFAQSGWDHGFHAYDVYNYTIPETRFYTTTRPYSEIAYMLGSNAEQMINLLHTQNVRPNWNVAIQYRLINSPGLFQNQSTNHNSYRFSSWYQSKNKRYQNFIVAVGNKLLSGENGGIKTDKNYLDSQEVFEDRSTIPTQLGPNVPGSRNFFNSSQATGTRYTNGSFMLRQQYDLGQKDSIVTDSVVIPLFYPRLRLEHSITYSTYKYSFNDARADSIYYQTNYSIKLNSSTDVFMRRDYWKEMINDFSVYQFPDAKNPQQFIKAGAALQNLNADFDTGLVKKKYYNFFVHGEYRNKTRNQKWDVEALGRFYINGFNAGDYNAFISLKRYISKQIGYLQVGFQNVNRKPSFVFNESSSLYYDAPKSLNKENTISLFGSLEQPLRHLRAGAAYHLITNYTYLRDYFHVDQAALFNLLQVFAEKQIRLGKHWNWRTWIVLQKTAGNTPLNVPLLFTRNQIGYDGKLGFKNLQISFGLESRYFTPYKASGYSPLTGQFNMQDSITVRLKFPEINAYLHFRIRSFTAYVRAENLNALSISNFKFINNNMVAPHYFYPGLQMRLGIFWSFVN